MLSFLTALIVVSSTSVFSVSAILDCTTIKATPLGDLFRRSTSYVADTTETLVTDQLLTPGWYSTGTLDMVPFAPAVGTCGTYNQVWTNSTLPKVGDGIQPLISCVASSSSNCSKVIQNQVVNCGTHRLYYLQPTSSMTGYCLVPSTITAGTVVFPPPAFQPKSTEVKYELVWEKGGRRITPLLKFKCNFDTDPTAADLRYIVYWYIDGVQIPMLDPVTKDNVDATSITEKQLNKLGVQIKCGIRVKRGDFGQPNKMVDSVEFFAGIKIHTPILSLIRGSSQQIIVEPTVPFGCSPDMVRALSCTGTETVALMLYDPGDMYKCTYRAKLSVRNSLTCGTYLNGIAYKNRSSPASWRQNYTIDVTTSPDDFDDLQTKIYSVYLTTGVFGDHAIWANYKLPQVKVNIVDDRSWKGKICKAHVDPHMTTSDQTPYESQLQGNYTFYKHKILPLEVQYSTKACNGPHQCPCRVSVRAGGDIFLIDLCGTNSVIDFVSCWDNIMDVHAVTEKQYKITLPTGTVLTITLNSMIGYRGTMNLDISMSVKDFNATEGLCGSFNGNPKDDFTTRDGTVKDRLTFINSWRVPVDQSDLDHENVRTITRWPKTAYLCSCNTASINSSTVCSAYDVVTCDSAPKTSPLKCRLKKDFTTKRRRRWASVRKDEEFYDDGREKRDAAGAPMSKAQARAACQKSFEEHPNYKIKDQLTETSSLGASLDECVLDVMVSGDLTWASVHLDSWVDNSMTHISRNNTFRSISPVIAQQFEENACPHSCSGSGNCTNGTCKCNDHFIAADCSIDSRTPPRIDHLDSEGVCDWAVEDCCDGLAVYGYPFVQTTMCNMERTMIYTDGTRDKSPKTTTRAQFRSLDEVVCPIDCKVVQDPTVVGKYPFVSTYDFSVSNDGSHFGQVLTVMVYDSTCQEIINDTTSISFQLKDGSCFIDQTCVVNGMQHPKDVCYVCDAGNQPYTWARDTGCDKTAPHTYGGSNHRPRHHSGSGSLYVIGHVMCVLMVTLALNLM